MTAVQRRPAAAASPIATGEGPQGRAAGQGGPGVAGSPGDPGGTGALADPGGLGGGSGPGQLTQPGRGSSGRQHRAGDGPGPVRPGLVSGSGSQGSGVCVNVGPLGVCLNI
ncbi:MAG TPA: hypothetical protein VFQ68_42450 [Streptosporangiaceae bacterium]|nr:hypothetical protein [Streptosporangiaceae bacterium]